MQTKQKHAYRTLGVVCVMIGLPGMASVTWAGGYGWTTKTDMPTARSGLSTSVVDDKIYAIGGGVGYSAYSAVEVYDPATDTWTQKADMPMAGYAPALGVVNGRIYVIGGKMLAAAGPLSTVEVYDPATDTWTQKADVPTARILHCAGVVNGKIYVIEGGEYNYTTQFTTADVYDLATDTWTTKAGMLTPRTFFATSVVNGKIYAIGGSPSGDWQAVSTIVEAYDPAVGMEIERLTEGLVSATKTLGVTLMGQATPLEIAVELGAPLETTASLRGMILDLSLLGIPSDLPLEHVGGGRYTASTTVTPLRHGHYDLPIWLETTEGERYPFLTVPLNAYPGDEYLYQDQIGSMWEAKVPSSGTLDLVASDVVHGGNYACAITLPSGILEYICTDSEGLSTFGYEALVFWLNPGSASIEELKIIVKHSGGTKVLLLVEQMGLSFEPGRWDSVSISLEELELVDTHLEWIRFGGEMEGTFYLDDIRFVPEEVEIPPVAVEQVSEAAALPSGYHLAQNYPNPFNPITTIGYALLEATEVTLILYTVTGQHVATLVSEPQEPGHYEVIWDGSGFANGVYLYRLEAGSFVETKRMVLLSRPYFSTPVEMLPSWMPLVTSAILSLTCLGIFFSVSWYGAKATEPKT